MISFPENISFRLRILVLLLVLAGCVLLPVSAEEPKSAITIVASGDQSYYLGEEIVLTGTNEASGTTYLFLVGPNLPKNGAYLLSPTLPAVSGVPESFVGVPTNEDTTWEYAFPTNNLGISPGTYTIYAVSQPKAKDQLSGGIYNTVSIIVKRPFITAELAPSPIIRGQPFTVTGYAEGNPDSVQLWVIGYDSAVIMRTTVHPDAAYRFDLDPSTFDYTGNGPYYLIVQHPMQNNQFDIMAGGEFVKNLQRDEGMVGSGNNVFKIFGEGSLRGSDTAHALMDALNEPDIDDTYVLITAEVTDSGSVPQETRPTQSPLGFAPLGALVLILGIAVWSRR